MPARGEPWPLLAAEIKRRNVAILLGQLESLISSRPPGVCHADHGLAIFPSLIRCKTAALIVIRPKFKAHIAARFIIVSHCCSFALGISGVSAKNQSTYCRNYYSFVKYSHDAGAPYNNSSCEKNAVNEFQRRGLEPVFADGVVHFQDPFRLRDLDELAHIAAAIGVAGE